MHRLSLTLALTVTAACAGPPAAPGADVHIGRLVYDPMPPIKSVRAYLGDELRLEPEGGGEPLVLAESAAVPREALISAAGGRVEIRCVMRAPAAPNPTESYPTGPDGQPMARPARCEVTSLRTLPPP